MKPSQRKTKIEPLGLKAVTSSKVEPTALRLWVVLARASNAITKHIQADVDRHDLTNAEFGILEALYHKGPLLLGDVGKKMLVTSGGITYLIDRLVAKGLVLREQRPDDRRARVATLTPAGKDLIASIFPTHAQVIAHALSGLSPREQLAATTLLKKLGLAAERLSPHKSPPSPRN